MSLRIRRTSHPPRDVCAELGLNDPESAQYLNAYIDGELSIARQQTLELLLVTDSALRARVHELAEVKALIRLAYGATPHD